MTTTLINIKKTKGIKFVYIGRGTPFGNPYTNFSGELTRDEACDNYQYDFDKRIVSDESFRQKVLALYGKTLGCSCLPKRCHGQTYINYLRDNCN
jgi:hypothetical protein